ncbi:MAG: aryl-sulfate sulfotransferase [Rhodobacteraceae bacterium]|nr:aryl-sulfate sulfotransferase [Paracoccaceae bacterium]
MSDEKKPTISDRLFPLVVLIFGIIYGYFATMLNLFPANYIAYTVRSVELVFEQFERPWYHVAAADDAQLRVPQPDKVMPGLVMVGGINADEMNFVRILDRDGTVVHELVLDWFNYWEKGEGNFPDPRRPLSHPGAAVHGLAVMPNGDLVFNWEYLSTMRVNACGDAVWKLDNEGNHSLEVMQDGNILVTSNRLWATERGDAAAPFQNLGLPLEEARFQKISADGKILEDVSVLELLVKNDLLGLVFGLAIDNTLTEIYGDILHMNDVEIYPEGMPSQIFEPGDIMVSLRNIHSVLVFDGETHDLKFQSTGRVLRQHDPDFIGDDKILVYDNRNLMPSEGPEDPYSRIAIIDARTGEVETYFQGEGETDYYSWIMGRQQLLENGNLMIAVPNEGRVMEIDPDGQLVWQYYNFVSDEDAGIIADVQVLPEWMDKEFFSNAVAACQ